MSPMINLCKVPLPRDNRVQESLVAQPRGARFSPGGTGMVAGADTKIVCGGGIDVQFSWNTGLAQRQIHEHAVLSRADDICPAMSKKNRRRFGRYHQAGS